MIKVLLVIEMINKMINKNLSNKKLFDQAERENL